MVKRKALAKLSLFHCLVTLGLLNIGPSEVLAQNTDSVAKANQLKEVHILRYRLSRQHLSPVPQQIMTAQELKRLNSLSVADAVRYFSGVQLKDYGGIGGLKTVNIRSMGSNHTGVFLDGVALSNAQNGQVDLGKYALDNIEEISLLSGQNPNLLQPAKSVATASAIFLKTKTPSFDSEKHFALNTELKIGDFGLVNPNISYQQRINNNLWSSVSTSYIRANGRYQFRLTNGVFDTTAVRSNGDVERFRLQAGLFGRTKDSASWNVQAYSFLSERGLPGAIISNKFDYQQRIWDKNFFLQGNYQKRLNKFELLLNAKLAYDQTRYIDPEYIRIDGYLDNRFYEKEAYVSAALKYNVTTQWQLALASDYQLQDLDANIYRFAYPTRHSFLNAISAAYTTNRLSLQGNLLSTTIREEVQAFEAGGNKQVFSPTFMFSWKVFEDQSFRIRGFYKDIFRMPTFNDLYYTFSGNTLLRPEYTKQYDLGLTYATVFDQSRFKYLEFQADAYYNTVKDKIIAQPGANLFRWIMYNVSKVEIKGLEANVKTGVDLAKSLHLGLGFNYTYQQAIDVTDRNDESYRNQIPYVPKHSGSFLGRLDYKQWKLNYSFIYTGSRYNQRANLVYNYMQPWYTHDSALGYTFAIAKQQFEITGEVNNLLNQYYDVVPNFPMPGRNYRLTLQYRL
ncbi:TonB-dependent receptor plug domain-containing protein [Pedobacter chitinilyticus]|uniref:TonB-dependent receptor n=1 Tax=Pedobacter chitinilyticus TaxID=2233776 RepID=A0A443Z152_9SPHI|nr:TonB-dependent receptor [Pedobacter chitinilyticus]RWU10234.1 TonB-dependent receptor [Pedobacter chitinilyticus]